MFVNIRDLFLQVQKMVSEGKCDAENAADYLRMSAMIFQELAAQAEAGAEVFDAMILVPVVDGK